MSNLSKRRIMKPENFNRTGQKPTYRDLIQLLKTVPDSRLDDNLTICVSHEDEFYPVRSILIAGSENDVLDEGHVFLEI